MELAQDVLVIVEGLLVSELEQSLVAGCFELDDAFQDFDEVEAVRSLVLLVSCIDDVADVQNLAENLRDGLVVQQLLECGLEFLQLVLAPIGSLVELFL